MVLSFEEARYLVYEDQDELIAKAGELARASYGTQISISKSVFLPLTHLCRNKCSYCGFRSEDPESWMTLSQVREELTKAKTAGVSEALFTMGEKPETVYESARQFLQGYGVQSTIEYTALANEIALTEFHLLPHSNPGVMKKEELQLLKPINASMGLMLESSSPRLRQKGMPHEFSPFKSPSVRIKMIREAGELRIPFTSGILIGIGETWEERIDSLQVLAELHRKYGHLQEIIVQNFQPLANTPMENWPVLPTQEVLLSIALARLLLPKEVSIQVPPNLNSNRIIDCLAAGANDLGGVSPLTIDYVNPTSPWPELTRLKRKLEEHGYQLVERLPVYPSYISWTSSQVREVINEAYYHGYKSLSE